MWESFVPSSPLIRFWEQGDDKCLENKKLNCSRVTRNHWRDWSLNVNVTDMRLRFNLAAVYFRTAVVGQISFALCFFVWHIVNRGTVTLIGDWRVQNRISCFAENSLSDVSFVRLLPKIRCNGRSRNKNIKTNELRSNTIESAYANTVQPRRVYLIVIFTNSLGFHRYCVVRPSYKTFSTVPSIT